MSNANPTRVVTRERVKVGIWRRRNRRGRWVYEISFRDSDGRQRRQTIPGKLADAETALADVRSRMGKGERHVPNPSLTFARAAEAWLEAKGPALTPKTNALYAYSLRVHLLPAFGSWKLTDVNVQAIAAHVSRMGTAAYRREVQQRLGQEPSAEVGYSAATTKAALTPVARTFAFAKRNLNFAGECPVTALDLDERPGYRACKPTKRRLNRAELDLVIAHARAPWREIIATAAALGTRLGETLGIEWRHVDFDGGTVLIEQQATAKREIAQVKSAAGVRRIEAPDWLLTMLRELRLASRYCDDGNLVFATATGRPHSPGNVLARGLYPAHDRAGLPRTSFHGLRHSHASLWLKDGGDPVTLSKRLGHASVAVTMSVYASEIAEASDHAVRKARVDALYAGTDMAATLGSAVAASGGGEAPQTAEAPPADVLPLAVGGSGRQ